MSKIPHIVIDTNVLVSGIKSTGSPPRVILNAARNGRIVPVYSLEILAEYARVLRYPHLKFTQEEVSAVLHFIHVFGKEVLHKPWPHPLPDPSDGMFLATAKESGAAAVATGNLKHFPPQARDGVVVLTPRELLDLMMV